MIIPAPVFWGVVCGAIYFLIMWWVRTRRLEEQRESRRLLYALSEEIVAAHTPIGIVERLKETLPKLLKASRVEIDLEPDGRTATPDAQGNHLLCLPLVSHEQPLGELKIYRPERSGQFDEEEQAAAEHIANIVSAALQLQKHQRVREKLFKTDTAEEELAPSSLPVPRTLTLMLIDPDPDSRRAVIKMLNSRGHRVVPCSVEECVEMTQRFSFDGVLRVSEGVFSNTTSQANECWLTRPVDEGQIDRVLPEVRRGHL